MKSCQIEPLSTPLKNLSSPSPIQPLCKIWLCLWWLTSKHVSSFYSYHYVCKMKWECICRTFWDTFTLDTQKKLTENKTWNTPSSITMLLTLFVWKKFTLKYALIFLTQTEHWNNTTIQNYKCISAVSAHQSSLQAIGPYGSPCRSVARGWFTFYQKQVNIRDFVRQLGTKVHFLGPTPPSSKNLGYWPVKFWFWFTFW